MWSKIKDALNSSVLWIVFLVSCAAYFWRKEKDTEDKLTEAKAEGEVKGDEEKQSQADHAAANSDDEYKRLRGDYLRTGNQGLRPGPGGETKPD